MSSRKVIKAPKAPVISAWAQVCYRLGSPSGWVAPERDYRGDYGLTVELQDALAPSVIRLVAQQGDLLARNGLLFLCFRIERHTETFPRLYEIAPLLCRTDPPETLAERPRRLQTSYYSLYSWASSDKKGAIEGINNWRDLATKQILARLDESEDNGQGQCPSLTVTEESVPQISSTDQPSNEATPGAAHKLFHDITNEFAETAEAALRRLQPYLRILLVTNPPATYEGKRILVDGLNKLFHAADMALKHPEREEAVTLLALSGGARSKKGYIQIRPTKGGELLNLPDKEPQLIPFRRYREASAILNK